jgi:hypothetical protein
MGTTWFLKIAALRNVDNVVSPALSTRRGLHRLAKPVARTAHPDKCRNEGSGGPTAPPSSITAFRDEFERMVLKDLLGSDGGHNDV